VVSKAKGAERRSGSAEKTSASPVPQPLKIYATPGTVDVLKEQRIPCGLAYKESNEWEPSAVSLLNSPGTSTF
jgi:hypothetical protein